MPALRVYFQNRADDHTENSGVHPHCDRQLHRRHPVDINRAACCSGDRGTTALPRQSRQSPALGRAERTGMDVGPNADGGGRTRVSPDALSRETRVRSNRQLFSTIRCPDLCEFPVAGSRHPSRDRPMEKRTPKNVMRISRHSIVYGIKSSYQGLLASPPPVAQGSPRHAATSR